MCKTVLASGVFDLFHEGHLKYLEQAKSLGDFLVVNVLADDFVTSCKHRPAIPEKARLEIVRALKCVDIARLCGSFDDRVTVETYNVGIRAVGPEYGGDMPRRENRLALERMGVRFVTIPRTPNVSSTIIKKGVGDEKVCCSGIAVVGSGFVRA